MRDEKEQLRLEKERFYREKNQTQSLMGGNYDEDT